MPVQFGHIKNVFLKQSQGIVLLQASSGMFLLEVSNASSDYSNVFSNFLLKYCN